LVEARAGRLQEATAAWVEPHVLIIDEVGYLMHAPDAANVLFGVVDQFDPFLTFPARVCRAPCSPNTTTHHGEARVA